MNTKFVILLVFGLLLQTTLASIAAPMDFKICAAEVTACFAAVGAIFGTVPAAAIAAVPALAVCNAKLAACMAAFSAALALSTP